MAAGLACSQGVPALVTNSSGLWTGLRRPLVCVCLHETPHRANDLLGFVCQGHLTGLNSSKAMYEVPLCNMLRDSVPFPVSFPDIGAPSPSVQDHPSEADTLGVTGFGIRMRLPLSASGLLQMRFYWVKHSSFSEVHVYENPPTVCCGAMC
jgi:hypothetical protein